jgi:glycosyltransferase involved in cell wall biosynthesis
MNIAIAHDIATTLEGSERVLLALADIFPEAPIYTAAFSPDKLPMLNPTRVRSSFLNNWPLLKKHRQLLIPLSPLAFASFDFSAYDLVISSSSFAAKGLQVRPGGQHICYCHTPTRYLWRSATDPRATGGWLALPKALVRTLLKRWDSKAKERPTRYLANSRYIAGLIAQIYGRSSTVIYPPVDTNFFCLASQPQKGDYFLFVSRLVDHKQGQLAIEACNQLGLKLKIVGRGPRQKAWQKLAGPTIEFLGYQSDEQLRTLYQQARAFIFPAEEDFGIVPVEAMACGTPVIAYGAGGALETVNAPICGLLLPEQTSASLQIALEQFIASEVQFQPDRIASLAQRFSQEKFKQEILDYIKNLN